jgi:hypothetical protein
VWATLCNLVRCVPPRVWLMMIIYIAGNICVCLLIPVCESGSPDRTDEMALICADCAGRARCILCNCCSAMSAQEVRIYLLIGSDLIDTVANSWWIFTVSRVSHAAASLLSHFCGEVAPSTV